jgi:DNA-binding transcriptional LysR family regulator
LVRSLLDTPGSLSRPIWKELYIFLAVAKNGAFSRAAAELGVSQPTVARSVERLQDAFKVRLLVITNQGIQLTAEGEQIARKVAELDFAIHSLSSDINAGSEEARGRVRVSVTDGMAGVFAAPSMKRFSERFPGVDIDFKLPNNVLALKENQTDMMIGFTPAASSEITCKQLGMLHLVPVASKGYIAARGMPTRENLMDHDFIQSEYYASRIGLWDRWLDALDQGRLRFTSDSMFTYGMLVKSDVGIGLLGSYTCIEPAAVYLDIGIHVRMPIYAVALTQRLKNKANQVAFDWFCDYFGPNNPWFSTELNLDVAASEYDDGFRRLFNI